MTKLFIFGLGYSARAIAAHVGALGWRVEATGSRGTIDFADVDAVERSIDGASHVLSSVPPARDGGGDPVLERYGALLERCAAGRWLGYLSSTGVYGDAGGAWVDESTPVALTGRREARIEADAGWLDFGAHVFRLPGIYGPSRSAFDRVREGRAHRIDLPDQVFSRVHVDDIVGGVVAGMAGDAPPGAYNLGDDLPCSQNAVIEEACRLLDQEPPPLVSLDEADLGPMARSFYTQNRRVSIDKAKRILGWRPRHPTYREGLRAIFAAR